MLRTFIIVIMKLLMGLSFRALWREWIPMCRLCVICPATFSPEKLMFPSLLSSLYTPNNPLASLTQVSQFRQYLLLLLLLLVLLIFLMV